MDCKNCEFKKRHFLCSICVKKILRHSQLQINQATIDRDEQIVKASKGLQFVEEPRARRAQLATHQRRVDDVMVALAKLRRNNEQSASLFSFLPAKPGLVWGYITNVAKTRRRCEGESKEKQPELSGQNLPIFSASSTFDPELVDLLG
ncbi:hypothetical protein BDN72DRAFT_648236 [Pluteus cervinus]|uniref:Uncharacterized protein n=1 Tax=Pluteus cervinus TaxID=181527 RepID=A0ACD3A001_9AGAR|nr:hypothetical protein BDN72DRAFT_648236 [Pluteus cervinus]